MSSACQEGFRQEVLTSVGATVSEVGELLEYGRNVFRHDLLPQQTLLPLADEAFVYTWEAYFEEAACRGVVPTLRSHFASLQGLEEDLDLKEPENILLKLVATPVGRIPLLLISHRHDFVSLLRILTRKNKRVNIPESQGACMISGYLNREHVRVAQQTNTGPARNVSVDNPCPPNHSGPHRLILATTGPYSGVAATTLGLSDDLWSQLSLSIRIEHECTHYLTRRLLGSMANKLLDEIIADFSGILAAKGSFSSDWFLKFMGVDAEFGNNPKGRLSNYLGSPPLSPGSRRILCALVFRAARNLEALGPIWDQAPSPHATVPFLVALANLSLEELASDECTPRVTMKLTEYRQRFCTNA